MRQPTSQTSFQSFPIWLRRCSIITLVASVGLLGFSVFAYNYRAFYAVSFVPSLLATLTFAIFLNIYSFWHLRRDHRETDQAFRATDCEFSSIFQNVLDAILITDSDATCLDVNPAATTLLRVHTDRLIGQDIRHFLADQDSFSERWNSLLRGKSQRGRAQLVAGDGTQVFVEFTATANYLPGRHVLILCDVTERTHAEMSLRRSEERFQHMANNIQEVFWMMNVKTLEIAYVNRAYGAITGHAAETLLENPLSYRDIIHPEDRIRVLARLQEAASSGSFDEEFRFIRADDEVRWVWSKGVAIPTDAEPHWLVGTAQDITLRKRAEMKIAEQLDAVEASRAEAEALRRATFALSQNLAMDSVLDTLLGCILELVPFDKAAVLFVEDGAELLVAREAPRCSPPGTGKVFPASACSRLQEILYERKSLLLPDLSDETDCKKLRSLCQARSWIGVPLVAAGQVLGILSLGKSAPNTYTPE